MINFNTDNIIIVCYPPNAGGKFLINCLGLSDNAVFQSSCLADMQLNLSFSQSDKINYLTSQLNKITNKWNDLNLGCRQLFGIENYTYFTILPENLKLGAFNPIISKLSHTNIKFFLVAHSTTTLDRYLNIWPNAKIIIFDNCTKFINYRSRSTYTLIELRTNKYRNTIKKYADHATYWDTNQYFSESDTINGIKKLYELYNLNNFNTKIIEQYYRSWISKLVEITQK